MADFRDVDPRELRVPPSRRQGADPGKLARQISLFGRTAVGMPPPWVYEGTDGFLGEAHLDRGLGSIEDDEILAILYRHRAELAAR